VGIPAGIAIITHAMLSNNERIPKQYYRHAKSHYRSGSTKQHHVEQERKHNRADREGVKEFCSADGKHCQ
jgi:hypothetical protein